MAEKRMTFFEHLEEFRSRLVKIVIAMAITSSFGYYYAMDILVLLKKRLPSIDLTYQSMMEPFMIKFRLGILTGFILALPVIFYQILAFLSPALKGKEKRLLYILVVMMVVLFVAGAALGYYYIMPIGAKWLLAQDEGKLVRILNVSSFISFTMLFLLAFGVAFETPVVLIILMKLGIVSRQTLRKNWRAAYITLMSIAVMATPDWSLPPMIILGVSMIILYELTLLIVRWI